MKISIFVHSNTSSTSDLNELNQKLSEGYNIFASYMTQNGTIFILEKQQEVSKPSKTKETKE